MLTAKELVSARRRQGDGRPAGKCVEPVRHRRPTLDAGAQFLCRPVAPFQPVARGDRTRGGHARGAVRRRGRYPRDQAWAQTEERGRSGTRRSAGCGYRIPRRDPAVFKEPVLRTVSIGCLDGAAYIDRLAQPEKGRSANIADHTAVADAIEARDSAAAKVAMTRIIGDVRTLIGDK